MELRTAVALVVLLAGLGTAAAAGVATAGADLEVRWTSDTARDNEVNHHAVGVGPNGTVVAPVAAVVGTEPIGPTSCSLVRLDGETGAVDWRAGVRPANCTTHALTAPAIGDRDGDGTPEVIAASTERALHVRSAATGDERWRVPLSTFGYGQPVVADLTPAPGAEVVVADIRGEVSLVEDGSVAWRADLGSSTWAPPIVADVDGDGEREIVVGTNAATAALSIDGDLEWQSEAPAGTASLGPAAGGGRLVLAAEEGAVRAIDGASGEVAWRHEVAGAPNVGDVATERRTTTTAYVGVSGGSVRALDARTGDVRWSTALVAANRQGTPPPALGDVDGDGADEVVAVVSDGTVAVLDPATGAQLATYHRPVPIWTRATLADVDDDGAAEMFVRYGDGRVVSLTYR